MNAVKAIIISVLLPVTLHAVVGQSPAPSPSSDCFTTLVNMSDCLTYVETGSKLTVPDKACCPELAGMVENTPVCLCQLLGNSSSLGIDIDLQKALKLPSACDIVTPSSTLCSAVGLPIPSEGPASSEILPTSSPPGNGSGSPSASSSTIITVVIAIALSLSLSVHINSSLFYLTLRHFTTLDHVFDPLIPMFYR